MNDDKKDNQDSHGEQNKAPSADYSVGYCRPPVKHRWKKGASGNPKGRPKHRERAWSQRQFNSDLLSEANAEIPIRENGRVRKLPMIRVIIRRLGMDAAQGKSSAARMFFSMVQMAHSGRAHADWKLYDSLEYSERLAISNSDPAETDTILWFREHYRKKSRNT